MMRACLVALVACSVACTSVDPVEPQVTSGVEQHAIPRYLNKQLDLLLVVDNTPAMAPYRDALRANLRTFADDIRDTELHLHAITADPTAAPALGFLSDLIGPDGERVRSYTGDLGDAFVALGDVGVDGTRSSPLAAAARVYEHPPAGFLRETAVDVVAIITPSDLPDESNELYAALFETVFGNPYRGRFLAVHGPGDRMPAFLARFPNSQRTSISNQDWSEALRLIRLSSEPGDPCIESPLFDRDPVEPGIQAVCSVWYEFPAGGAVVPACDDAPGRECWRLDRDPVKCPTGDQLVFTIDHERSDFPEGAMLKFECLTATQQIDP